MRILIVEDDAMLADGLARSLRTSGYAVDTVDTAERAMLAVEAEAFDLVILDVGLPGMDGFEMLRRLRKAERHVPVIVVTARDAVSERVRGLDLGADDYLVKPFALEELEARLRALARRGGPGATPVLRHADLEIDFVARSAMAHGKPIELTAREWALAERFFTQPGIALSKERIAQSLSSWDERLSPNAVEVYVSRLRAKLEAAGVRIRTVRGFGYLLERADEGS